MLKSEWNKMFIHHFGLSIILIYLLLHLLSLCFFTEAYDLNIEENKSYYEEYMGYLEGELTEEKENFVREENLTLSTQKNDLDSLRSKYYYGEISEQEFREQSEPILDIAARSSAFKSIYNQYLHVKENSEQRYFLYTNGWNGLLADSKVNYLLLFVLVLLIVPMFCEEQRSSMNELLMSQKKSAVYQVPIKVFVAVVTVCALSFVSICMDYLYYMIVYGLPDGSYTLQSLLSYGATSKKLTLNQAFLLCSVLKIWGYIICSIILLFFSSALKKYGAALAVSVAVIILPYLFVENYQAFYLIPGPWSFVVGVVYLAPALYQKSSYTGELELIYQEASWRHMGVFCIITFVLLLFLVYLIWRQNRNKWIGQKGKKGRKKIIAAFLVVILIGNNFWLAGCQRKNSEETIVYNYANRWVYETENNIFYSFEGDDLYGENIQTGERFQAVRNVTIQSNYDKILLSSIFGSGRYLYYMRTTWCYNEAGESAALNTWSVVQVDTENFEERIIYEETIEYNENFLDINLMNQERQLLLLAAAVGAVSFFLDESNLYLIWDTTIYQLNLSSGTLKTLVELPVQNCDIAFDGETIYYPNDFHEIMKYNISTGKQSSLEGVVAQSFWLSEDGLYYINTRDNNCIYYYNWEQDTSSKVGEVSVNKIWVNERQIYYIDLETQQFYCMDKEENNSSLLYEGNPYRVNMFEKSNHIYLDVGTEILTLPVN